MTKPQPDSNSMIKSPLLSKQRKREILSEIAKNSNLPTMIRIRAIELDSYLVGHFMPERKIIKIGPNTLAAIEELINNLVSAPDQSLAGQIPPSVYHTI